jgi:hypothetical protein
LWVKKALVLLYVKAFKFGQNSCIIKTIFGDKDCAGVFEFDRGNSDKISLLLFLLLLFSIEKIKIAGQKMLKRITNLKIK